jgi:membrane-associated protease RseP (regulator of RpoE activity)
MFGNEPGLQFRVFGIPVQVSLFFLLIVFLLGRGSADGSPLLMVAWVAIAFASVLLHELGHALSARAFGQRPYIELFGLGGVTTWRQVGELPAGRRFLISAAGPGVGLVIGFIALFPWLLMKGSGSAAEAILSFIVFANLGWGILNLLPMLPLDGGKMMASFFELLAPGRGNRAALYGSIVTAVLVAPLALASHLYMLVLYCGLAVWFNVAELRRRPEPPVPPAQAVIDVPAEPLSNEVNPGHDRRPN